MWLIAQEGLPYNQKYVIISIEALPMPFPAL